MLHGVQHKCGLLEPSCSLPSRMRREPIVWEAGIGGTVLKAVLKELDLHVKKGGDQRGVPTLFLRMPRPPSELSNPP